MSVDSIQFAARIRAHALRMVHRARASHIGGALSMADILAVLYSDILRVRPAEPGWPERDRLILSKGHNCSALYAALAVAGFIPEDELQTYGQDDSRLMAHISHKVPGVEFSTGSLGHGLPFGGGKALAAKRRGDGWRTYVVLSDGELDEGSNWEAMLFAAHHGLDNLVAIVDHNHIQSLGTVESVIGLHPLAEKLRAFRWSVREVDGHDHDALRAAFSGDPGAPGRPTCVIATTVKGKGVDFMEGELKWHYASPSAEQLESALAQVNGP